MKLFGLLLSEKIQQEGSATRSSESVEDIDKNPLEPEKFKRRSEEGYNLYDLVGSHP